MRLLCRTGPSLALGVGLILASAQASGQGQAVKPGAPLPEGTLARFLAPKGQSIRPIGFNADGKTLVLWTQSPDMAGDILLGNISTGKTKTLLSGKWESAALAPDGKAVVTYGRETPASMYGFTYWSLSAGAKLKTFPDPAGYAYHGFAITPDGNYLAWHNLKADVYVRSTTGNSPTQEIKGTRRVTSISFSPDGKILAIAYSGGGGQKDYQVHLWATAAVRQVALLTEPRQFSTGGLTFSPDSKNLAVGGSVLDLWDVNTKRIGRRILQPSFSIQWLPDGLTMVGRVAHQDKSVPQLLEVATGEPICKLHGHNHGSVYLAVDLRGTLLASGDQKEVLVWDLGAPPGYRVQKHAKLSAKQLTSLWQDLDAKPPAKGYRALLQLAEGAADAVNFLQLHLAPAPAKDAKQVQQFIKDLGSDEFPQREQATKALKDLGRMVQEDLQNALKANPPAEAEQRLQKLLEHLKQAHLPGELRHQRAIVVLERIGSKEARELLQQLAAGAAWSPQTQAAQAALNRLAKWDKKEPSR